jgi:tetratricopeptide (TPR) repeat protein
MQVFEKTLRLMTWRYVLVATAVLSVSACTTGGTRRPARVEVTDDSSFTITEEVRVSFRVRDDFESALHSLAQGDYDSGIALLVDVTETAPHLTTAHIDLAIAYGRVNDLERAEASIKKALDLNPRHPVALNELGIIYRKTGRFAEARGSYEKALELHPNFHFARRNLAILCDVFLADLDCALEHYQYYTKEVPGDEAAAMWVADLRARTGK